MDYFLFQSDPTSPMQALIAFCYNWTKPAAAKGL
jgi:hypothetical protein